MKVRVYPDNVHCATNGAHIEHTVDGVMLRTDYDCDMYHIMVDDLGNRLKRVLFVNPHAVTAVLVDQGERADGAD